MVHSVGKAGCQIKAVRCRLQYEPGIMSAAANLCDKSKKVTKTTHVFTKKMTSFNKHYLCIIHSLTRNNTLKYSILFVNILFSPSISHHADRILLGETARRT